MRNITVFSSIIGVLGLVAVFNPGDVLAYSQGYYQAYYQSYYEGYYQGYYQGLYLTLARNVKVIGNLTVTGAVSKGGGTFEIDHPLDPKNKLLYHSFVESPDVKNIYDGIATLDAKGAAVVQLPGYYDALNERSRYKVFPLYQAMPDLHISSFEKNNTFAIAGGVPGGQVSWQITGIRHDPYILKYPLIVEVLKTSDTLVPKGECLVSSLCQ